LYQSDGGGQRMALRSFFCPWNWCFGNLQKPELSSCMGGRAAIRLETQTSRICTTSAMSDPGKFVDPTITIPGNPVDSAACISEFARLTQPGCGVPTLDSRVQYILHPGAALVEVSFLR